MRAAIEPAPAPVQAPAPAPAQAASPTPGPSAAAAVGALETGSLHLSADEILSDLERGESKLQAGDIASARRYFERVALAGDARGAIGMARSHDPDVLAKLPVVGLEPDASAAASWYDKAKTLRAGP
jgi:TPR repeat protein